MCLRALDMGDSLAVEIAQQAHANVLRLHCNSLKPEETQRYRSPVPRPDFIELLAINDHVGVQRLKRDQLRNRPKLRDTEVFPVLPKPIVKLVLFSMRKCISLKVSYSVSILALLAV